MRQILFRGKRVDNNDWVEGCYQKFKGESKMMTFFDTSDKRNHEYTIAKIDKHLITQFKMPEEQGWNYGSQIEYFEVIPETVGQFTGLLDKNGNKIFEGDLLHTAGYYCEVKFIYGMFCSVYNHPEDGETLPLVDLSPERFEIIGNIYEN